MGSYQAICQASEGANAALILHPSLTRGLLPGIRPWGFLHQIAHMSFMPCGKFMVLCVAWQTHPTPSSGGSFPTITAYFSRIISDFTTFVCVPFGRSSALNCNNGGRYFTFLHAESFACKTLERQFRGDNAELCISGGPGSAQCCIIVALQSPAKKWSPGCVNAAGQARQKWYARAVTTFTKPASHLLAKLCKLGKICRHT